MKTKQQASANFQLKIAAQLLGTAFPLLILYMLAEPRATTSSFTVATLIIGSALYLYTNALKKLDS
ncbi:hypothetical protein [Salinibius halmophilus]|uniref:hypothetical protein n=1 Tax=Salinibius halmophilus TaxID=1853216 RepID=UPI000E6740CD|nr:hypothetical protein [Salinibius halmophilus]